MPANAAEPTISARSNVGAPSTDPGPITAARPATPNELNTLELSRFLFDTYQRRYAGADVLWEIMRATRTGRGKIGKYTPSDLHIGGKTGTYSGPNESRATIHHPSIGARNHAAVLFTGTGTYGISVLSNTSSSEDVASLGGGLMREYLGVEPAVNC